MVVLPPPKPENLVPTSWYNIRVLQYSLDRWKGKRIVIYLTVVLEKFSQPGLNLSTTHVKSGFWIRVRNISSRLMYLMKLDWLKLRMLHVPSTRPMNPRFLTHARGRFDLVGITNRDPRGSMRFLLFSISAQSFTHPEYCFGVVDIWWL